MSEKTFYGLLDIYQTPFLSKIAISSKRVGVVEKVVSLKAGGAGGCRGFFSIAHVSRLFNMKRK